MEPELFPAPSWLLTAEAIDARDADHGALGYEKHAAPVGALETDREKILYLQTVLDVVALLVADTAGDLPS